MNTKIQQFINTKQFHICMVGVIIFVILFVAGLVSLKYIVEGEGNLPFGLSKISIISVVDAVDDETNKRNKKLCQNNDIYLYIEKNENYKETEAIQNIKIDNFNIIQKSKIGTIKMYKPNINPEEGMFKNSTDNEVQNIEYIGGMDSSINEQRIANQGGIVAFRYANIEIADYVPEGNEEINQRQLASKLAINNEDLKFKVTCDIYINLVSGKSFKATMNLELPINDVVSAGIQSIEYTDLEDIVFKRI